MLKSYPAPRQWHVQEQIFLDRALFCVGCEIIFTGTRRCPRCNSVEAVWSLSEWVRSARPATTAAPLSQSPGEESLPSAHEQKRSAA
jgi:hypothetical protein